MFATIRRIALAVAGAAALIAAATARGDHDASRWQPPAYPPPAAAGPRAHVPPARAPALALAVSLPAPPAWLRVAPPAPPVHAAWTRHRLEQEYRWLDTVRARFHRHGPSSPWRARQFEAWYQARRAELDRRWTALAWAPGPREGWRADRWDGRGGEGRGR